MKKIQKSAAQFDNLKQDFLDDKKYSGTAEATLNGYRYDITRFLKFLSDEQLTVDEAGFKRYVIHLTDSGMTANSVNHYIRSVKVFLYWCIEQDEIAPFKIKMVKAQETIKDVYTQEELCALIQPPKREDSFVIWRSWAIINFILGTAAREATVCEMQIHDFSRLARSTKDLLAIVEQLQAKNVHLVSNKENLDTSTPTGKLMLTMIAAINEFERENLLERQREGITIAKAAGKFKGGQVKRIDDKTFCAAYDRYQHRELNKTQLAAELRISRPTLNKLLKDKGLS